MSDYLLNPYDSCPHYAENISRLFSDDIGKRFYEKYKSNWTEIAAYVGFDKKYLSSYKEV